MPPALRWSIGAAILATSEGRGSERREERGAKKWRFVSASALGWVPWSLGTPPSAKTETETTRIFVVTTLRILLLQLLERQITTTTTTSGATKDRENLGTSARDAPPLYRFLEIVFKGC
jgi:hypothetical protein